MKNGASILTAFLIVYWGYIDIWMLENKVALNLFHFYEYARQSFALDHEPLLFYLFSWKCRISFFEISIFRERDNKKNIMSHFQMVFFSCKRKIFNVPLCSSIHTVMWICFNLWIFVTKLNLMPIILIRIFSTWHISNTFEQTYVCVREREGEKEWIRYYF